MRDEHIGMVHGHAGDPAGIGVRGNAERPPVERLRQPHGPGGGERIGGMETHVPARGSGKTEIENRAFEDGGLRFCDPPEQGVLRRAPEQLPPRPFQPHIAGAIKCLRFAQLFGKGRVGKHADFGRWHTHPEAPGAGRTRTNFKADRAGQALVELDKRGWPATGKSQSGDRERGLFHLANPHQILLPGRDRHSVRAPLPELLNRRVREARVA